MVAAVRDQGGFDSSSSNVSAATILSWVNQRYRDLVAKSKWRKAMLALGPTVAGQAQYAIPENVVDVLSLRVDSSRPWGRTNVDGLWQLTASTSYLTGPAPGVFVPNFEADDDQVIELWPVPETAGLDIDALCALLPAALELADTPRVPEDFHESIVDGAIGMGMERIDERHDEAKPFNEKFDAATKELARRQSSRVGSGPTQIRVAGRHF